MRQGKGLTGPELARRAGVGQATISRIETGKVVPSLETLQKLLDGLEAPRRTRARLLDQLRTLQSELSSWEAVVRTGLRRKQDEVRKLETASSVIRIFQPALVPGLLQTARYAERVLTLAVSRWGGGADVPGAVTGRLERQGILMDTSKTFGFVVTEAALRWRIGPADVMVEQLQRLASVSRLPNLDLAVLPLDGEVPAVPLNAFVLFDDRHAIVETFTTELVLRDLRDIAVLLRSFEAFRAAALNGDAARDLLERVADDHRRKACR